MTPTVDLRYLSADSTQWLRRGRSPIAASEPVNPAGPLFAGHVPYRVLVGMNAPEDKPNPASTPRPQYAEASTIIGQPLYTRRVFSGNNWFTASAASNLVAGPQSLGQLPVMSFKVASGGSSQAWDTVVSGAQDSVLTAWRNWAKGRRASAGGNGLPVLAAVHHEPDGNGPIGDPSGADRIANLELWGQMQLYLMNWFTGWASGSYVAADDVSDIMPWCIIPNGHWFGLRFPKPDRISAAFPPALLAAMQRAGGPIMPDFYDANPPNGDRLNPGGYAANADRTSRQMTGFLQWARANGVKSVGCGEFGCTTAAQFFAVWDLLRANRDIWAIAMHFNNFAESRWDWRLLPAGYPAYNPVNGKGLADGGGDATSASYLAAFKTILDESISAANTAPM